MLLSTVFYDGHDLPLPNAKTIERNNKGFRVSFPSVAASEAD